MSRRQDKQHSRHRQKPMYRSDSPKYDRYARQKKPDPAAEELIKFVREYQNDHNVKPTALTLQKRAPLPSIGQSQRPVVDVPTSETYFVSTSVNSLEESDADDGLGDSYPDVDDDLDFEVASCTDSLVGFDDNFTKSTNNNTQTSSGTFNVIKKKSKKRGKAKKRSSCETRQTSHKAIQPGRTQTGNIQGRKLPPLIRDDLPERPTGPVPLWFTNETSHSPDNFILEEEEEPIDYIE